MSLFTILSPPSMMKFSIFPCLSCASLCNAYRLLQINVIYPIQQNRTDSIWNWPRKNLICHVTAKEVSSTNSIAFDRKIYYFLCKKTWKLIYPILKTNTIFDKTKSFLSVIHILFWKSIKFSCICRRQIWCFGEYYIVSYLKIKLHFLLYFFLFYKA